MVLDSTLFALAAITINYLTLWRALPIAGDIMMLTIGGSMYFIDSGNQPWGMIVMFIAIADLVYRIFAERSSRR